MVITNLLVITNYAVERSKIYFISRDFISRIVHNVEYNCQNTRLFNFDKASTESHGKKLVKVFD